MKTITEKIKKIIIKILDLKHQTIPSNVNIYKKFNIDSLDTIEIIMTLEEKFDIDIPEIISEKFDTIESIAYHIQKIKTNEKK